MPEKRLAKCRDSNQEINCNHTWLVLDNSDKAPFILEDKCRKTTYYCMNCDASKSYTRSQKQFEKEIRRWVGRFGTITFKN